MIEDIRARYRFTKFAYQGDDPPQAQKDIDLLLAEIDRIETKHESQLDDACAEIGEIRGCDKCDLCEDHH